MEDQLLQYTEKGKVESVCRNKVDVEFGLNALQQSARPPA